jgi:hypothetical protein
LFFSTDTYRPIFNDIVIEVNVRGKPKPSIVWIRDGQFIENGAKYEIFNREEINNTTTAHLIINNAIKWDSGKYTIVAENRVKKVEMVHHLEFEGKKEISYHKHEPIKIENETRIRYRKAPRPEGEAEEVAETVEGEQEKTEGEEVAEEVTAEEEVTVEVVTVEEVTAVES